MKVFSQMAENFKDAWSSLFLDQSSGGISNDSIVPKYFDLQKEEKINIGIGKNEIIEAKISDNVKELHSETNEITAISKSTVFIGSLTSEGNIRIAGYIKGNVTSSASITISGIVEGDVIGDYVSIQNGSVTGNVTSKSHITISEKSTVEGDIKCNSFDLNGNVKGNVQVQSSAKLGNIAAIQGTLSSQYLSIQKGAVVNGLIRVNGDSESSSESIFHLDFNMHVVAESI